MKLTQGQLVFKGPYAGVEEDPVGNWLEVWLPKPHLVENTFRAKLIYELYHGMKKFNHKNKTAVAMAVEH
jgi:hypothetical protein